MACRPIDGSSEAIQQTSSSNQASQTNDGNVLLQRWSPCTGTSAIGEYIDQLQFPVSYRWLYNKWSQLGEPTLCTLRTPLSVQFPRAAGKAAGRLNLREIARKQEEEVIESIRCALHPAPHQQAAAKKLFVSFASHLDVFCAVQAELIAIEQRIDTDGQKAIYDGTWKNLLESFELDRLVCHTHKAHNCLGRLLWGDMYDWPLDEVYKRFDAYRQRSSLLGSTTTSYSFANPFMAPSVPSSPITSSHFAMTPSTTSSSLASRNPQSVFSPLSTIDQESPFSLSSTSPRSAHHAVTTTAANDPPVDQSHTGVNHLTGAQSIVNGSFDKEWADSLYNMMQCVNEPLQRFVGAPGGSPLAQPGSEDAGVSALSTSAQSPFLFDPTMRTLDIDRRPSYSVMFQEAAGILSQVAHIFDAKEREQLKALDHVDPAETASSSQSTASPPIVSHNEEVESVKAMMDRLATMFQPTSQ